MRALTSDCLDQPSTLLRVWADSTAAVLRGESREGGAELGCRESSLSLSNGWHYGLCLF
jgi:hypothetical protein